MQDTLSKEHPLVCERNRSTTGGLICGESGLFVECLTLKARCDPWKLRRERQERRQQEAGQWTR